MKPEDFDLFASLVKQRSGLVLTREKAYLLESRLLPLARKYNLTALEDMAQLIRSRRDETMMNEITEAMTTNESSFFRDQKPFAQFRTGLLPKLLNMRATRKHIRIWSAAASSGQEAYSIAMICAEEAENLRDWKVDIIGTDLSRAMVERAQSGIYTHFEVQRGLPIRMLVKYFQQLGGDKWQIKENLRQMVQFREGNLLQDLGSIGIFDIIYCRNVLMYFDPPTKTRVLDSIRGLMAPDGALFVGDTEAVLGVTGTFKVMEGEHGIYVPSAAQATGATRQAAV